MGLFYRIQQEIDIFQIAELFPRMFLKYVRAWEANKT
jgi:hypothetical protein